MRLWNNFWFTYTKWNGIIGPSGKQIKIFRKERIWQVIFVAWLIFITIYLITK